MVHSCKDTTGYPCGVKRKKFTFCDCKCHEGKVR